MKYADFINQDAIEYQANQKIKPYQMVNFLTNHDTSRALGRYIPKVEDKIKGAKALATFLLMQKGIPCINYGEEIMMDNGGFKSRSDFRDVDAHNAFKLLVDQDQYYTEDEMLEAHNFNSRDNARMAMAWDDSKLHDFSHHQPWIKFANNAKIANVKSQLIDPDSVLNYYKQLIKIRKQHANIIVDGKSEIAIENDVVTITRTTNKQIIKAVINFSNEEY